MNYGETFVDLLTNALRREEVELAELAKSCSKPSLRSICQYDESWVKPLVAKEAMRHGGPLIRFEKKRVDISIYDDSQRQALVELKGPFEIKRNFHPVIFDRIIEDVRKQGERHTVGLECFMILLIHGLPENVEGWVRQDLLPAVARRLATLHLMRLPSGPIPLNGPNLRPHILSVVAFRVRPA